MVSFKLGFTDGIDVGLSRMTGLRSGRGTGTIGGVAGLSTGAFVRNWTGAGAETETGTGAGTETETRTGRGTGAETGTGTDTGALVGRFVGGETGGRSLTVSGRIIRVRKCLRYQHLNKQNLTYGNRRSSWKGYRDGRFRIFLTC